MTKPTITEVFKNEDNLLRLVELDIDSIHLTNYINCLDYRNTEIGDKVNIIEISTYNNLYNALAYGRLCAKKDYSEKGYRILYFISNNEVETVIVLDAQILAGLRLEVMRKADGGKAVTMKEGDFILVGEMTTNF